MKATRNRLAVGNWLGAALALLGLGFAGLGGAARGTERPVIKLWPGAAPLEIGEFEPESEPPANPKSKRVVRRLTNVTEPRLEFYLAPEATNTGAAVIVAPGGGYNILAIEHEGTMVAEWLNAIGVNAVLLRYRVPRRESDDQKMYQAPLADAQRAFRLVRRNAAKMKIDPDRVGMLGFSAGGHLTLVTGVNFDRQVYEPIDDADELSARPDFLIPVYPAYLVFPDDGGKLPPEIRVTDDTPPAFFAHAGDDQHSAEGSARIYIELRKRGIPAEIHVYAKGGHGFGMMKDAEIGPATNWPDRCEEWMRAMGWLEVEGGE